MDIETLINKYYKLIYKICFNMLSNVSSAEDATQETYILIYKNLYKYNSLPQNELKNIICKIALNKCKDILRKNKINNATADTEEDEVKQYPDNIDIEEALIQKEKKLKIEKMINELKKPYNQILYKYYIQEKTLDEISEELNIKKATLKVQINRGKNILKQQINQKGGEDLL